MNRQYLFNNLWYGENSRENNILQFGFVPVECVIVNGSKIFGIDISHWNKPPVNLKRMVEMYNLRFVIIKGCDGSVNSQYYFEHVAAAKEAGIPWGMYVWLYPAGKVNIDAQVNAWHARSQIDPPPMGIFIDAEWTYYGGLPANPNATDLRSAHDKIRVRQGKPAITYTAKGYADTYLKGFDWSREELWAASWGVTMPVMPNGATGYILHQFTSTWKYEGVNYDGNYFNGTDAEFIARYGGTPPPNGGSMNGTAQEKGGRVGKIRATPSRYGTQTGTSPAGATIEFVRVANSIDSGIYAADQWFELPDGRYLNYIISGAKYFTILTMPTTEPPPDPDPTPLPATYAATLDVKDTAGTLVASYKGTLSKQ
jgi:GH25 family lysozyme M1 (1,4-beta-N-acetylmuramidase)